MASTCWTFWSCHRGLKELQYPLFDFAAKRLLDPSDAPEADWSAIVRRNYGGVSADVLDELTVWSPAFYRIDGRVASGSRLDIRQLRIVSNSQFVHRDLVQGIEIAIAIAIGIGVDFIIDPGDFDPDSDPDPDEPSHIENC